MKIVRVILFLIFSKIFLKFLNRILFPAVDIINEVLGDLQTIESKLKWESTASTSNTLQKYGAHMPRLSCFTRRRNTVMVCEPLTEYPMTYNISGGWRNLEGGDVTKQESGWKYEQMEPKLNALKL